MVTTCTPRHAGLLGCVAAIVLAGCGSGGSTGADRAADYYYGPHTREADRLDIDAKSNASSLVTYVESCFSGSGDYSKCTTAAQLGDSPVRLGGAASQAEVARATATTYVIAAHSVSGNTFLVSRNADGTIARTCSRPGRGGCRKDGVW